MNWKKLSAFALSLVLTISLVAACGGAAASGSAAESAAPSEAAAPAAAESTGDTADGALPFAGVELNIAVEDGGQYAIFYDNIKSEFEALTGAKVNLLGADNAAVLAELMAGSGYYDVLTMDGPYIPQYATLDYLEPLDGYISAEDKADFYESAIDSCSWNGTLYTIPYLVHGPVIYYRTDLFEAAGLSGAPTTDEEYREYAKLLNDPANGVYGSIVEGKQNGEMVSQWTDKILQFGGRIIADDEDKIVVNSPENVAAFEWALGLLNEDKSIPPESANYDNGDVQNMFLQGQVAFVCNWPYMWSMCNDEEFSKVKGKVAVAPQPITNAVWNWSFGVCAHSKNKDAAYAWCQWACSPEVLAKMGTEFINPVPRKSAMDLASAAITSEEDRAVFEAMNASLDQGIAPRLSTNYGAIRDRLALSINRIFVGDATDIQAELDAAAAEMQTLLDEAETA